MWLYVPNCETSPSAPAGEDSISPSSWQFQVLAQSAWWRGKPMPREFWVRRWSKASWLRRLCGAMPEPSVADLGVALWMASLEASPANPTASPDLAAASKTSETSGPPHAGSSSSQVPGGASSKTSAACSPLPMDSSREHPGSDEAYGAWVGRLRADCSARQKLALRTNVSGFSFSAWPTPRTITGGAESAERKQELGRTDSGGGDLQAAALTWSTPRASDGEKGGPNQSFGAGGQPLHAQAVKWPTPVADDSGEKVTINSHQHSSLIREAALWCTPTLAIATGGQANRGGSRQEELLLAGQARDLSSHLAQQTPKDGKNSSAEGLTLNPPFVEALMAWPTGWTAFACSATEWSHFKARMRFELLRIGLPPVAPPVQRDLFG